MIGIIGGTGSRTGRNLTNSGLTLVGLVLAAAFRQSLVTVIGVERLWPTGHSNGETRTDSRESNIDILYRHEKPGLHLTVDKLSWYKSNKQACSTETMTRRAKK